MSKKLEKVALLEVEWGDATGSGEWQTHDEVNKQHNEGIFVKSIGYLFKSDKAGITLCHGVGPEKTYVGTSFIPSGMVRKIRKIKY